MPKLSDEQQEERRVRILDAAERCFMRAGFHRTTMQDICKEAGVSPGAFYVWFASKEDLIGGISARNRDEVLESFSALAEAEDFVAGMVSVLDACILNQPREKSVLCLEIGAEATRNPAVAATMARFDQAVSSSLTHLLNEAVAKGRIRPTMPIDALVSAMEVIADGLFWRRAVDPSFDGATAGQALVAMVSAALRPAKPVAHSRTEMNSFEEPTR